MSRAEELPVICAMEEFAKRYPFLAVYSDKNFALFRNCRGPDTRSWMSNEAIMAKTAIAINMILADLNADGWGILHRFVSGAPEKGEPPSSSSKSSRNIRFRP